MKTKNYLSEAQNFLKRNTQVKSFDIVMHDCNGVGRGKIIRRNELLNLYKSGRQFPLSLLGMDITGEDTPETGLILEQGDGDIKAWPIPSSLKLLHNSKPPRGELFMNMYDIDDNKLLTDPRNVLENKIQELKKDGISCFGAFELEFNSVAAYGILSGYGGLGPSTRVNGTEIAESDFINLLGSSNGMCIPKPLTYLSSITSLKKAD